MIEPGDLQIGNWISLDLQGSLLQTHRVLEINKFCILIESGKEYSLTPLHSNWEYPRMPRKQWVSFGVIKGIPLMAQILESCGFAKNKEPDSTKPASKESFTIEYNPRAQHQFVHKDSGASLEFVHQLQNLYASSTHKQLEITLQPYNFQLLSFK